MMRKVMLLALVAACGEDGDVEDPGELVTTVVLEVTPVGGTAMTFTSHDPDGDGGTPPMTDAVTLTNGTTYAVAIKFENRLEMPAEDITIEVRDEGDQHQVFLLGTAVNGPATNNPSAPLTHTYADMDANNLPIGLANTLVAKTGAGDLTVVLKHLPPLNDTPQKTADAAMKVKASGLAAIGGGTDANVTFMVTVQ